MEQYLLRELYRPEVTEFLDLDQKRRKEVCSVEKSTAAPLDARKMMYPARLCLPGLIILSFDLICRR
jgi:hypothetical protein